MNRKNSLLWIVIVAVILIAGKWSGQFDSVRAPAPTPGAPIEGRAKITDGDSLEIAGERIRLFGIDAPEGRQQCRDKNGAEYACGREAARALERLIGGRTVTCRMVEHDQYQRDVATCAVGGQGREQDLGDAMVRSGHARDYPRHSRGRYAAAEREAREAKRGLWAGEFENPGTWRKREMK